MRRAGVVAERHMTRAVVHADLTIASLRGGVIHSLPVTFDGERPPEVGDIVDVIDGDVGPLPATVIAVSADGRITLQVKSFDAGG
jgi:hypothetical protein